MLVNWIEKRKSPRINLKVPLHYQVRGMPEINSVVSGDISVSGVGFVNDKFIVPNNYLKLQINLLPEVVSLSGRVVRADSLRSSDRFRIGVEFVEMEYSQKQALSDFISKRTGS